MSDEIRLWVVRRSQNRRTNTNEQDTYITVCKILNTKNTETQTDKIIHVINHIRTCRKQISANLRTADIFAFPFYLTTLLSPVPLFCILFGSGLCNRNVPFHWARGISEISNRNFCWMELWKALLVSIFELLSLAEGGQFATINQSINQSIF